MRHIALTSAAASKGNIGGEAARGAVLHTAMPLATSFDVIEVDDARLTAERADAFSATAAFDVRLRPQMTYASRISRIASHVLEPTYGAMRDFLAHSALFAFTHSRAIATS